MRLLGGYELGKILADLDMLPRECADIELKIPADGLLQLHFTVNVLVEDLPRLAQAFTTLHKKVEEEEKERIRIANILGDGGDGGGSR